jgi:hypothetical protein
MNILHVCNEKYIYVFINETGVVFWKKDGNSSVGAIQEKHKIQYRIC